MARLLHHGGRIRDQEGRIVAGEMPWPDALDRGDEGLALGGGQTGRRFEALAPRIERGGREGRLARHESEVIPDRRRSPAEADQSIRRCVCLAQVDDPAPSRSADLYLTQAPPRGALFLRRYNAQTAGR